MASLLFAKLKSLNGKIMLVLPGKKSKVFRQNGNKMTNNKWSGKV